MREGKGQGGGEREGILSMHLIGYQFIYYYKSIRTNIPTSFQSTSINAGSLYTSLYCSAPAQSRAETTRDKWVDDVVEQW